MDSGVMNAGTIEKALLEIKASSNGKGLNGCAVLDEVDQFIGRFVLYPSSHARYAHVLWIAHTWLMDKWDSTPRIMFVSPEPGSGKTRALEVSEPLVPRPVHAVNTTPAYLFRKVSDIEGPPTILYDEIDTVFGPKAKENEDVRGMLNAGHRRGATAGRCVTRGKVVETEELPAYCAVALAGLGDLPDTIMTRSVIVRMKRRAPGEHVEPWRMRKNTTEAEPLKDRLELWAAGVADIQQWPDMPEGVEDRNADVWESLLAVADLAGGHWPMRARVAAVTFVTQSAEDTIRTPGLQLLADLREIFTGHDRLATEEIIQKLHALPESAWLDLRGKALDARGLSVRIRKYAVKPKVIRIAERTLRGYERTDFEDAWGRYLPSHSLSQEKHVTSVTSETDPSGGLEIVSGVTSVTHKSPDRVRFIQGTCSRCNLPGPLDEAFRLCGSCDGEVSDDEKEEIAMRMEVAA